MATKRLTQKEVRDMSDAAIVEETARRRDMLYTLRQQSVTEKLENNREPGNLRKEIARLLTEQKNREIAATQKETA